MTDICGNTFLDGTRSYSEFRRLQWEGISCSIILDLWYWEFWLVLMLLHPHPYSVPFPFLPQFLFMPALLRPWTLSHSHPLLDAGRYMVFGDNCNWDGQRRTPTCRSSPYESSFYHTSRKSTTGYLLYFDFTLIILAGDIELSNALCLIEP